MKSKLNIQILKTISLLAIATSLSIAPFAKANGWKLSTTNTTSFATSSNGGTETIGIYDDALDWNEGATVSTGFSANNTNLSVNANGSAYVTINIEYAVGDAGEA